MEPHLGRAGMSSLVHFLECAKAAKATAVLSVFSFEAGQVAEILKIRFHALEFSVSRTSTVYSRAFFFSGVEREGTIDNCCCAPIPYGVAPCSVPGICGER